MRLKGCGLREKLSRALEGQALIDRQGIFAASMYQNRTIQPVGCSALFGSSRRFS
jgi:hypothetical protein